MESKATRGTAQADDRSTRFRAVLRRLDAPLLKAPKVIDETVQKRSDVVPIGLHHVQIAIPTGGEEIALGFYGGLIGLQQVAKPANLIKRGGIWFSTATLQLHLGIDQDFVPAKKAHVALEVPDLASLRVRFAAAGVAMTEDEPLEGYDRFYVSDPFGNRLECLERVTEGWRGTN